MIASVSTLARSSGATSPRCWWKACMCVRDGMSAIQPADVDEMSGDRRRRRHGRTDEVRAPAVALAAFEVAVGRRRAAFARLEAVVVHREAHRAARLAPLESRVAKHAIEAFGLCLRLDQ